MSANSQRIPNLLSIEEAAFYLDVSTDWLYRHPPNQGGPPRGKWGNRLRYYRDDLDRWRFLQRELPPGWSDLGPVIPSLCEPSCTSTNETAAPLGGASSTDATD